MGRNWAGNQAGQAGGRNAARPGAGGILGAAAVAQARPDGYTLTQIPISVFRLPHMQKVAFNALTDFTYVICVTGYTFGLVVQAESPIRTFKDLIAFAKANPEKFTYGSPGTGTTPQESQWMNGIGVPQ